MSSFMVQSGQTFIAARQRWSAMGSYLQLPYPIPAIISALHRVFPPHISNGVCLRRLCLHSS